MVDNFAALAKGLAAVVAVAALLVIGVMAVGLCHARRELSSYSPKCDFDLEAELNARAPGEFSYREFNRLPFDEVRHFGEYARLEPVRELGVQYETTFDHIPEHYYLTVFLRNGEALCAALAPIPTAYYAEQSSANPDRWFLIPGRAPDLYDRPEMAAPDPLLLRSLGQ